MILPLIINITLYTATIDVVSFYTSAYYKNIKIIFKIIIIEVSCITFTFILIGITVNKAIYDTKENEFIFLYLKQMVINLDIFI